jgi:multidrug resistance efflux pump
MSRLALTEAAAAQESAEAAVAKLQGELQDARRVIASLEEELAAAEAAAVGGSPAAGAGLGAAPARPSTTLPRTLHLSDAGAVQTSRERHNRTRMDAAACAACSVQLRTSWWDASVPAHLQESTLEGTMPC